MDNKNKADRIHDLLPKFLNTKTNTNWKGLIDAIGQEDEKLAQLITEVRKQFFIKTSYRPYIDTLAANNNISRPKLVGMSDESFRSYIPVLSYKPKQVKLIIDSLLDIFFFKEATSAFLMSTAYEPFSLQDGWDLHIKVDNTFLEDISFKATDFTSISNAGADEIVASYNRQAKYSFATNYYDSITKHSYIRIFTNTVGSKGSLEITGGLANIALKLNGFISTAGNGTNTQWTVTRVGDTTTFTNTGGASPGLNQLQAGDILISNLPGNSGSFVLESVDISNQSYTFTNLFSTVGVFTQTSADDTKYFRPEKFVAYKTSRRAIVWETASGEVTVEMPTTPPVVQRSLKGSMHLNGLTALMTNRDSDTSLSIVDATNFPGSGSFWIEPVEAYTVRILTPDINQVVTTTSNGRLIYDLQKYTYTGVLGNTLTGISPSLPSLAALNEAVNASLVRNSDVVTVTANNTFEAGDIVYVHSSSGINILNVTGDTNSTTLLTNLSSVAGIAPGQIVIGTGIPSDTFVSQVISPTSVLMTKAATATASGISIQFNENVNGSFTIESASLTQFTYKCIGTNGAATNAGTSGIEGAGLANINSKIVLTTAQSASDTRITGSYVWDTSAAYVLSDAVAQIQDNVIAGKIVRLLNINTNHVPNEDGFIMFDYGKDSEEGPVRYLYKPADNVLALDPSYLFQKDHPIGSSIVAISHKGAHQMSGLASEYGVYITDPSEARFILETLIQSVVSAGIFVNFLVRYPEQLYGTLDVYKSGVLPEV